jgi:hypothetical protein
MERKTMINGLTNYFWVVILSVVSAYVTLNFYLLRILFKRTELTNKIIDDRIDVKINAKTAVLETKIDAISANIKAIMDAIFKDVHLVNNDNK